MLLVLVGVARAALEQQTRRVLLARDQEAGGAEQRVGRAVGVGGARVERGGPEAQPAAHPLDPRSGRLALVVGVEERADLHALGRSQPNRRPAGTCRPRTRGSARAPRPRRRAAPGRCLRSRATARRPISP